MSWRGAAAALAGAGAVVVAGALLEAHAFRIVRHDLTLTGTTGGEGEADLRILHIGDTHYLRGQRDKAAFVASLASTHPDLVVATGDLLSDDAGFDEFMAALSGLTHLPGVFVFGSNDYFAPALGNPLAYLVGPSDARRPRGRQLNWRRVRDALTEAGWRRLDNRRTRLQVAGLTVDVRGSGDAHMRLDDYAAGASRWVSTGSTAGASTTPAGLVLGVMHAPYRRILDAMHGDGVALMLAGHTHGGQICLPGRAIVTNCDLPTDYAKGLHRYPPEPAAGESWLHVTGGIGTAPSFPLRTFNRPEACILDVKLR